MRRLGAGSFVRLSRRFFADRLWRRMWRSDGGPSNAVLPVLALMANGRPANEAIVWPAELMELAAITRSELKRARLPLIFIAGATLSRAHIRGAWRAKPGPILQTGATHSGFRVPGRLVVEVWPTLTHAEMTLILALAAQAEAAASTDWVPEDVVEWVSGFSDECFVARETESCPEDSLRPHLRRLGRFDASWLAGTTGMTSREVQDTLASLRNRRDGMLAQDFVDAWGDHWFHLPSALWALPSEDDGTPLGAP